MKKNKQILASIVIFANILLVGLPSHFSFAKKVQKQQVATSIPVIYPRSAWSNAKYDKRTQKIWPVEYSDPEVVIVHHTATNYKSSTSKQIKKIYRYHSYTRRWGDIGYNYIIGKDGLIFEGRYGGNGVIAGHAYYKGTNYNKGSIGIAVLGNYESGELSSAARDSLERLIGWLAVNNSIFVKSSMKFHGKSLDNSVIGHRDVASTTCPGKNIYKLMSDLRTRAENLSGIYSGYAYQVPGDDEKYEISGGKRYAGSSKASVVQISKIQLEAYPLSGTAKRNEGYEYPSGTLVFSGEKKGLIENGMLRQMASSAVLDSSYNPANFVEVAEEKWKSYPNGTAVGFRSGAFVKDESGNYFLISASEKRRLNLASTDLSLIDLGSAHSVADSELAGYIEGNPIDSPANFPGGTLITADYKRYFYVVSQGEKKEVTPSVFRATFSRSMTVKVSRKFLKSYKTAGKLSFQNGAVVSYRGKYYFIENGARRQFASKKLAASMGYQNIQKAKRTEMAGIGAGARIE